MNKEVSIISDKQHDENEVVRYVGLSKGYKEITVGEALKIAESEGLDVVFVSEVENQMPYVKLMNYEKFQYEKMKQKRHNKSSSNKNKGEKEIRFSYKISEHDMSIKMKQAIKMVRQGYNVKVGVTFKGREINMVNMGYDILDRAMSMISNAEDAIKIKKDKHREGSSICMLIGE